MSADREAETPTQRIHACVFLNYASEDRERAVWLQAKLFEAGMLDVWIDRAEIEGGENWKSDINEGLLRSTVLLALLTKFSTDLSRKVIVHEQNEAKRLLKPIIPLRFDAEAEPPEHLAHLQYIDFTADENAALLKLRDRIGDYTLRSTSLPALPGEPPSGGTFVGRDKELQELFAMIQGTDARAATGRPAIAIQAMGGQGKTVLAEELVRRIALRYPGGLLIERRGEPPKPRAEVVFQDWAKKALEALGQRPDGQYDEADVRSLLGRFGTLLVLIDDVHESDFGEVEKLLRALPADATRLLTTRSLNAAGVFRGLAYSLQPLNDEDAGELVRGRLLAWTGASSSPDTPAQEAAIRRLVGLVQGHALALELTAAQCKSPKELPRVVEKLARSLGKGVDGMAVDLATAPSKKDSVAVCLNISLEQLEERDRERKTNWAERFAVLGVFPDGSRMNQELVAAVWGDAGGDDELAGDALDGLYRQAMIKYEPDEDLYYTHPLLRAFARGLLEKEPGRLAAAQLRYREFLTRTAERGFGEPEEKWAGMNLYVPHLLHTAAQLWEEWTLRLGKLDAHALPDAPAEGVPLADPAAREAASRAVGFARAFMGYVLRRPELGEDGRRLLTLGLACVRAAGSEELLDTFVRALGAWYARGNPTKAERYFEQARRWADETGDPAEQGKVLSDYGELQRNRGELGPAIDLLSRALVIHKDLGDPRMQAVTHKSLGEAYCRQCHFVIAREHYDSAVGLYRGLEDISGEADLSNKIGSLEFNRGNYKEAVSAFRKARRMHKRVGNRSMEGEDLNDAGISYTYLGRPKRALLFLEKAIVIHGHLGNRRLEAIAISNRAGALCALGRECPDEGGRAALYGRALLDARKAGEIAHEVECKFTEVWALNWEALAQQGLGRPDLARERLERAENMLKAMSGPREQVTTWGGLGYLLGKYL
ncbi:MAG TPA: tetratricopeptide repeat protein, partial [Pyrinomonadaceae bacterium]